MHRSRALIRAAVFPLLLLVLAASVYGQDRRLGRRWGAEITYEPRGPGVLFDALDPTVKKWYVPQELFVDYGWNQSQYSNYARENYERYVNTSIEGEPFYDLYGNYLTRGWLVYDWTQNQPTQFGSSIFKDARFNQWFNAVTISSDSQGQFFYALTVGDRIRTTLTPLTFSKPSFNGVQWDFASDKYQATMLFSRASRPIVGITPERDPSELTNATNLMAGRTTAQIGDFVQVGATLVNARNSRTFADAFERNPLVGTLAANQGSAPVSGIALVLSDDSPEDGRGGATLFTHDIAITSEDPGTGQRNTFRLRDVVSDPARWPVVIGGALREGALAADGDEKIVINYDFTDIAYTGPRPTEIVDIQFDLVVANDYRIQVWSDRQTGRGEMPNLPMTGGDVDELDPALFEVARAGGNVKDNSNQRRIVFDYGLPSAKLIYGFTLEATDAWGLDLYAEYDVSRDYDQFPNAALQAAGRGLATHAQDAEAWTVTASKVDYPYFFLGEAYSLDPDYNTTAFIVDEAGDITYDETRSALYEFVDDNDDQDRLPDWFRLNQGAGDDIVFPGWDENNDFVSDFNQNDSRTLSNRIPDYEEPFFRYSADRPEFLFGIDLNNNGWIDRFENDDLPDYPYRTDRRGYNIYGGAFVTPHAKVTLGRLDEESLATDGRNRATYGLVTYDRDLPRGRVRVFDMLKRVEDNIADDRREMTPHLDVNSLAIVNDLLPARDTWVNSAYVQLDYRPLEKVNLVNKFKYDLYAQQGDAFRRRERGPALEETTYLLGLINKVDYTREVAGLILQPKLKSEFLRQTAFVLDGPERKDWTGTGILLLRHPLLQQSLIEGGVEFSLFRDLVLDEDEALASGPRQPTQDFQNLVLALQWTNAGEYLGYKLTTQFGFSYTRRWEEVIRLGDVELEKVSETSSSSTSFITVYAGIE
ncbi:MAG: hypothetical protein CMQ49_11620 [Gammaproteobacteria bacterium]|nr:hypothetical protein [Gammaproteobacteria bacterium]